MKTIAQALDKSIYRLNFGFGTFCTVLLIMLGVFVAINFVSRWVGANLPWAFSGSIVILITFAFLIAAYALGEGKHVTVDVILQRLSENGRTGLEILGLFFSLLFSIILGWETSQWVRFCVDFEITTSNITFGALPTMPMWILVSPVLLGALLLILQSLRLIVKKSSRLKNQGADLKAVLPPIASVIILFALCILMAIYVNPLAGLFLSLMVLLFSGTPVAFALGIVAAIGLYLFAGGSSGLGQLPIKAFSSLESFPAVAMPLFILIGPILERAGWANSIASVTTAWLYRIPGSLLMITIVAGAIICALTGSSVAATALLTMIFLPQLIQRAYDKRLSCGTVLGASVGTLIPPSGSLILFGLLTENSLGKLFMAAIFPALIIFGMYGLYIFILSYISRKKFGTPVLASSWTEKLSSLKQSVFILFFPILILGGIYVGIFTATEAAGAGMVYIILITLFSKKLTFSGFKEAFLQGSNISSMTTFMLVGGVLFGTVVSQLQVGPTIISLAEAAGLTQLGVILVMFCILLILGMFMSAAAMLMITIPMFYPLALAVGIDPLWLGVFFAINLEIGLLTPPVGLNLFVLQGISGIPLKDVILGTLPFILMLMLSIAIMYCFPVLINWLPKMMASGL